MNDTESELRRRRLMHYQRYHTWYEVGFITLYLLINNTILATSMVMENSRNGQALPFEIWEPFVWEYSSAIALIALIPSVVWLIERYPLNWQNLKQTLLIYLGASLVFSILHVAGMVGLRKLVYLFHDHSYHFGNVLFEFIYEYRKDLWSFVFIIGLIQVYQFILSRLQGEAQLINENEDDEKEQLSDRMLVKKLGKEFVIKIDDIEWFESSGNYVNLHIKGHVYPIRSTLSKLVEKMKDRGFCRIHRSHGINLDAIESITPCASGDSEIKLHSGKILNLSRRYKEQFKMQLG